MENDKQGMHLGKLCTLYTLSTFRYFSFEKKNECDFFAFFTFYAIPPVNGANQDVRFS